MKNKFSVQLQMTGVAEEWTLPGRVSVSDLGPKYFFLAMIALKLPIGLGALALTGLLLFFTRRFSREWRLGLAFVLGAAVLFLLVLTSGSSYAGIRHALPVVVLLSLFAGITVQTAFASNSKLSKVAVVTALVGAAVSAVPVMRPWEYFNELAGGTKNAHLYFNDEGVDLEQRRRELAEYYHRVLEPAAGIPLIVYGKEIEQKAHELDWLGHDWCASPDKCHRVSSNPSSWPWYSLNG